MFEAWYRRLGPRYPRLALLAALCGGYATGALATAGTALYIDMSLSEVVRLMAASWILIWLPEFVVAAWIGLRTVAPISSWVSGAEIEHPVAGTQLRLLDQGGLERGLAERPRNDCIERRRRGLEP